MSESLPQHPDLDQLRRRAKELRDAARRGESAALERFVRHHRSAGGDTFGLAAAQLVVARELGFSSWPRLKDAVDAATAEARTVTAFVSASVEGRMRQAADILRTERDIARRSLPAATVLGDATAVRDLLAADPVAASAPDRDRGWPPLLYACYSRWHRTDPGRAAGMAEVVRLLLDAGANPNTNDGGRPRYRSALKGAVEVNNPDIVRLLLEAGAHPDPGQPIAEAAGHRDQRCLRLLLSQGARVTGTWALGAAVFHDDPVATSLLLDALATPTGAAAGPATEALPEAAANASLPVVEALLAAGADPLAADEDGVPALRLAVRAGKGDSAARLRALGAADDATEVDQFIGACLIADRPTVQRLLAHHPDLPDRLTQQERAVICQTAGSRPADTVALMLQAGFSPHARNSVGEQPLHNAAYLGNAAVVRLLLDAGAEVDARDDRFDGTPLAFATVGSREQADRSGDWIATVRQLLEAGADRRGVWISGKQPSEEVIDLLRQYDITPDRPAAPQPENASDLPDPAEAGELADIAVHLEAAFRDHDMDLFGSLLHPKVRWTGLCSSRTEVLDWLERILAEGTRPTVESVEVDRDAVVLGITLRGEGEGARPAPPQRIYQVFTIDGAQIVEIHGYPDHRSALTRT
ncbi:ankyrin repeat protein [Streptacidiphilus sp. MAP12-20]|uniref:ankyrin repeat domain-containing protein n=1 Tax=Streptacidiphilus sp. MAP12-20 TaxID=3156299 RepID=UPI003516E7D5